MERLECAKFFLLSDNQFHEHSQAIVAASYQKKIFKMILIHEHNGRR